MINPFSLEGKRILVTGASSGIGKSTAIECSRIGAEVVVIGRDYERLKDTFLQLEGINHIMYTIDLNSEAEIDDFLLKLPLLDGIVHCAGIISNLPFLFLTREKIEEIMNINFYAPVEISRRILKAKKLNKGGSIVFLSSVSGIYCSSVASSIYSASKGAINGIIKGMALDLANQKIRVNSVNPGVVETRIFDANIITLDQLEEEKKRYPLKRFGKPEEIAYAVIYLLSDASRWVTGSNLLIDGGFTLL